MMQFGRYKRIILLVYLLIIVLLGGLEISSKQMVDSSIAIGRTRKDFIKVDSYKSLSFSLNNLPPKISGISFNVKMEKTLEKNNEFIDVNINDEDKDIYEKRFRLDDIRYNYEYLDDYYFVFIPFNYQAKKGTELQVLLSFPNVSDTDELEIGLAKGSDCSSSILFENKGKKRVIKDTYLFGDIYITERMKVFNIIIKYVLLIIVGIFIYLLFDRNEKTNVEKS